MSGESEQLYRPHLRAPALVADGVGNIATISSGDASVDVAATAVKSDSLIFLTVGDGVTSLQVPVNVSTKNIGTGFTIATPDGTAAITDVPVMWMLFQKQG